MLKSMKNCLLGVALVAAAFGTARSADLFIATTAADFGTGSIAMLRAGANEAEINLLNIHSDTVVRYYDGIVYLVNRLGQDNILRLDPADPGTPLSQYSVGAGSNPQDIVVVSPDKAYVTLMERDYVLVLDPADGAELGRIDLSALADADGFPEAAEMVRVGDRVYVAIQRLDRDSFWAPVGDSYLAIIDIHTDEIVNPGSGDIPGFRLASTNPGAMEAVGTQIVVQQVGNFTALDGGIEVIDTETLTSRGLLITEEQLGGNSGGLAMVSPTRGFTTVSSWPDNAIHPFDLETGTVGEALEGHSGGYTPSLVVDGQRLIAADRGTAEDLDAAGLLIYDAHTGTLLAGPINTGLPPNHMAVLSDDQVITAVTESGAAQPRHTRLGDAYPNPFNTSTQIPFVVRDSSTSIRLEVYDVLGRRVRTLHDGPVAAGEHRLRWDGRNDAGQTVGNGVYMARLRTGAVTQTIKFMLIK